MVVAIYKQNRNWQPEQIRIHKYDSDGKLRVEAVGNSYAHEVGGIYDNLTEVEEFLAKRDKVFGYTLIVKR